MRLEISIQTWPRNFSLVAWIRAWFCNKGNKLIYLKVLYRSMCIEVPKSFAIFSQSACPLSNVSAWKGLSICYGLHQLTTYSARFLLLRLMGMRINSSRVHVTRQCRPFVYHMTLFTTGVCSRLSEWFNKVIVLRCANKSVLKYTKENEFSFFRSIKFQYSHWPETLSSLK